MNSIDLDNEIKLLIHNKYDGNIINECKELKTKYNNNIPIFGEICRNNYINLAMYWSTKELTNYDINIGYYYSFEHVRINEWLKMKYQNRINYNIVFETMCLNNDIKKVKEMYNIDKEKITINPLSKVLINGSNEMVKYLDSIGYKIIMSNNLYPIDEMSKYNRIDNLEWLLNNYKIKLNNKINVIIYETLMNGHLKLAQKLISLCNNQNIKVKFDVNSLLKILCCDGKLDIIKWLLDDYKTDVNIEQILFLASKHDKLSVCKYLYNKYKPSNDILNYILNNISDNDVKDWLIDITIS